MFIISFLGSLPTDSLTVNHVESHTHRYVFEFYMRGIYVWIRIGVLTITFDVNVFSHQYSLSWLDFSEKPLMFKYGSTKKC